MEADDWVTDMQIALETAHVAIADWVPYATYLLCADSADWWCNFKALRAPVLEITWDEFNKAFKKHHIPEGLMERKSEEFCNLTQGKNSVMDIARSSLTWLAMLVTRSTLMLRKEQDSMED